MLSNRHERLLKLREDVGSTPQLMLREMDDILASAEFRGTEKHAKMVKYCTEETLLTGIPPSEFEIALEVFERNDYDPEKHSHVRVAAIQIRKRLLAHYESNPRTPVRLVFSQRGYGVSVASNSGESKTPAA